jgi:hypothetical protein
MASLIVSAERFPIRWNSFGRAGPSRPSGSFHSKASPELIGLIDLEVRTVREILRGRHWFRNSCSFVAGLMLLVAAILVLSAASGSVAAQTRDQCHKCCSSVERDEYYLDQCKLKCFRNPDHCTTAQAGVQGAPPEAAPQRRRGRPAERPPQVAPQTAPQGAPQAMPQGMPGGGPQPPSEGAGGEQSFTFKWPDPLNLTPGKEWEAAGQILAANGVPPQHPGYASAVKAIEGVLVDFARRNPQGGNLPATTLKNIILRLK